MPAPLLLRRAADPLVAPLESQESTTHRRYFEQPEPKEHPTAKDPKKQFSVEAFGEKVGGGKNTNWVRTSSGRMYGRSREEVLEKQEAWLAHFVTVKKRSRPTKAPAAASSSSEVAYPLPAIGECDCDCHLPPETLGETPVCTCDCNLPPGKRLKRRAAPTQGSCCETDPRLGPMNPRAGPGRGHCEEPTKPTVLATQVVPPSRSSSTRPLTWLDQAADHARHVAQLETQLASALQTVALQGEVITALRARVHDFETALRDTAEEILSTMRTAPPNRELSHADALKDHPEWQTVLGAGYSEGQRRTLYRHVQKLLDAAREITGGDALKAKQLTDLLYARVHAGEERVLDQMAAKRAHFAAVNEGIALSLREFVHAMHERGGKGRWPYKLRQAQQVIAAAVSKAAMISRTSYQEIGDALGLDAEMISACRKRFDALNDGDIEQLFDERAAERSDTTPDEWLEFAADYWKVDDLGFVRTSEKMSDEIRDPNDRKAPKQRVVYLESRIGDMYLAMKRAGEQRFEAFKLGETKFRELRPFYVKDATRETCMCIYHLRWSEFATGLLNYRHRLRKEKVSTCSCNFNGLNDKGLRKQLVCERAEGC